MPIAFLILIFAIVLVFSGITAMAGIGAAFLFVPVFYYLGIPLSEAVPTALLLNTVSLSMAAYNYWRGKLINWSVALPMLVAAVIFSPIGARLTPYVDKRLLLGLFAGFLLFAGSMMLFYHTQRKPVRLTTGAKVGTAGVGAFAGFLGGLLGVGGGNFILPVLNWIGLDPKIAVGTTSIIVITSSLSGFLGHATMGRMSPAFLVMTCLAAVIGSWLGSQLMKTKVSGKQLKKIIGVVLLVIAVKMAMDVFK